MKRTTSIVIVCHVCEGPGSIVLYDRFTEESRPEKCTYCNGLGILLQTTIVEEKPITQEDLIKRRKLRNAPIN